MPTFVEEFPTRYSRAITETGNIAWIMQLASYYSMIGRQRFYQRDINNTSYQQMAVFDNTCISSLSQFAGSASRLLLPRDRLFAKIVPGSEITRELEQNPRLGESFKQQLAEVLDQESQVVMQAINESNFHTASRLTFLDLGSVGDWCRDDYSKVSNRSCLPQC